MNPRETWTEEEREALAALGHEVEPAVRLEERTVDRLRREGLVGRRRRAWWSRLLPDRRPALHLGWASAAAAFALATFFAGMTVGQQRALSTTAEALASFHESAVSAASARVQETGSAYVTALAALGRLAASAPPQEVAAGREAAFAALYAAAAELARLDPDDPVAARLLQSLERADTAEPAADQETRQIVWF